MAAIRAFVAGLPGATSAKTLKQLKVDRQRRITNRNRREHDAAMRSLGLVKTPYGWE